MATEETVQTTEAVTKKPSYLLPKFTSERWSEGVYDADHKLVDSSMDIREDDLLTFDQRVEVETRSLIFQYQLKYAEKEYELLKKEFQSIEARLNQLEASDAEPAEHDFVKPVVPKKYKKNRTKNKSSSETDEKDSSADEPVSTKGSGKQSKKKKPTDNKSGSEADKEFTSSQEATYELRRPVRKCREN